MVLQERPGYSADTGQRNLPASTMMAGGDTLFRNLIEQSRTGFFVLDKDLCILYVNSEARILLQAADPSVCLPFPEFFNEEERAEIQQLCQDVLNRGDSIFNYRGQLPHPDGENAPILVDLQPHQPESDFPGVIQGSLRDISDLSIKEQELIEEKERLETILGSVGAGMVIVDRNRNVFYANEVMRARFKRPSYRTCYSYYGRNEPCQGCVLERVLSGEEPNSLSVKGTDASSRECWLELLCTPVRDKGGEIIGALEVVMDVTEKQSLAERVRVLAEAVENMLEGVVLANQDGHVVYANPSFCRQVQQSVDQLEGRPLADYFTPGEENPESFEQWLASHEERLSGEYTCQKQDGDSLPVMLNAFRIEDQSSKTQSLVAVSLDLTERKRLEGDLVQSSKLAALGELISGITHELNNPLAAIMGYSQLVLRRIDEGDDSPAAAKLRKSARAIFSESERASKIIRNLLTFARRYRPEKNPVDVNEVLETTFDLRGYDLKVNNVNVETEYAQGMPMIMADFNQLQQVILNLVNNAVHAMLEHGGPRMIRVRTYQKGNYIKIEFKDSGPGVPQEIVRKIFDPFFTTKEVGKGTGLGLSICFGIIKEHGGSIHVESQPGKGATFLIDLPITSGKNATTEQEEEDAPGKKRPPLHVLVVDDERHIREILKEYLEEEQFTVETASDGYAALEMLGRGGFDLIITDMKMPRIDGRLLYEAIQRQAPEMARRVIFATGDTLGRETSEFLEATGNPNLQKPIKLEKVLQAIDQIVEKENN